ncbi:MAG TPA: UDP-N-acetylglucosamine 2-epimerase (non-hydrolyzing) [Candidatus Limnocylindrales bacterium]
MPRKIMCVVGARPNFMKMAPLMVAFRAGDDPFECILVHTGQHYDVAMSDVFFTQLGMPAPDVQLGIGPGKQGEQTGRMIAALETVVADTKPDLVLVVGDVNSTLAATLVAAKAGIPLAHVEAGLRSFDRRMPEEINRIATDALATYLFTTEEDGVANLRTEGVSDERIFFVGNVMIDTLLALMPTIKTRGMAAEMGLAGGGYGVVTLHRPSNVDDETMLAHWMATLERISTRLPLVFPAHPRTAARLAAAGLDDRLAKSGVKVVAPLPYVEFISLVSEARLVLTDSGGIQEETTVLGVPCLTLRDSTERPITVKLGTNTLVGAEPEAAVKAVEGVLSNPPTPHTVPPLWDGKAAERIVQILRDRSWTAYLTDTEEK